MYDDGRDAYTCPSCDYVGPNGPVEASYGECPICGAPGEVRCRCRMGDTRCANGHGWHYKGDELHLTEYPSDGLHPKCGSHCKVVPTQRTADWFRDFETFDEIPEPPPPQPKPKRKRKRRRPTMEEESFTTNQKLDWPQDGARRRVETYRGMPQFPQIQDTLKRIAALRLLELASSLLVTVKKP